MNDQIIVELAGDIDSARQGILMDALDDAGYGMTAQILRGYSETQNDRQLEFWRARLSGDLEVWSPPLVEKYWRHIHTLRKACVDPDE